MGSQVAVKSVRTSTTVLCRACHVACSLVVEMEDGHAVKAYGDKDNPISHGYSCIRGREIANYATLPSRLKTSLARNDAGELRPIASEQATQEIADKLRAIIAAHGPRSVAAFIGTFGTINSLSTMFLLALLEAIGTPMFFTPEPIDQPGKAIANALHGKWLAGVRRHSDGFDVALLFGSNPLVSNGGPFGTSPGHNLHEAKKSGTKLIVCDPRRTETAQKADVYLQVRPGEDVAVIAGIIRVILAEELYDKAFVDAEAGGLDALRRAVDLYTPAYVEARADVPAAEIVNVARIFADAPRGLVHFGTGPNMSGNSTLCEYLGRVLTTLTGNWPRAGERVGNPGVLMKFPEPIAATPGPTPANGLGEALRVHGLSMSASGMPTAALPDEILTPGDGKVRALIILGGNPMVAFPDQEKTFAAMKDLDLLVCIDPRLSATARLADYVISPTLLLETPGVASFWESASNYGTIYGYDIPYQQYSPAITAPPPGSDLIEEWGFFYKVAQKMGLKLNLKSISIQNGNAADVAANSTDLDMSKDLTPDEAWALIFRGSPVPYEDVRTKGRHGHVFVVPEKRVSAKPDGWTGRFDIGNQSMMTALSTEAWTRTTVQSNPRPFRLISRRLKEVVNSNWLEHKPLTRKYPYNAAYMNPGDMERIGVATGDVIRIESDKAAILGIAEGDATVKAGCISMSHGWGANPNEPEDPYAGGTTSRLCDVSKDCDPVSWIPVMSAIPVTATPYRSNRPAAR